MRLFLIRHGQTPANVLGQLDTAHPGPGLTTLGGHQAAGIPAALQHAPLEAIFASTLVRTQLTAQPLSAARRLDVRVVDGLHEIEAGALEGLSDRASVHRYLSTAIAWGSGDLDERMPGATTGHDFFERFDADIAVASQVATAAVFSHGAAIRVWTAGRAVNVSPEFAGAHELQNTGVVELTGSPSQGWTLVSWAGTPVGGTRFAAADAEDPLGEAVGTV